MDFAARNAVNLSVLKRHDEYIVEIIDTSSHVVVYLFDRDQSTWTKKGVEGTISIQPVFGFIVMNRLGLDNFMAPLVDNMDLEFKDEYIIYRTDDDNIKAMFERKDGSTFDYVFNLAAETKYSQNITVYEERIFNLSVRNAKEAARRQVKVFVELSTAQIYKSSKEPNKEDAKIEPWTTIAKYKYKAEEELKKIQGPAMVYGLSATMGLVPRLVCGRIYQYINEEMKFLWNERLKVNTVHVHDVSRAMWYIAEWYQVNHKADKGPLIYNLADPGDTDQEKINNMISTLFNITTGFHKQLTSYAAEKALDEAVDVSNEKHMKPWTDLTRENKINNTPLTPYLDKEILYNNDLSVDGRKICDETQFNYEFPEVTQASLKEIIDDYVGLGLWPGEIERRE
ncbi:14093_t:CDS:2 [Entrophospora sp. SA101]|nr:14093_t:CDS:2 [Entrophospora sp. SA101]